MFNPGDRVYLLIDEPDGNICLHQGSLGTVLEDWNNRSQGLIDDRVFVRWDDPLEQSDEWNGTDDGHIWFVKKSKIMLCNDTDDGNEQPCSDEALADFIFGGAQK